VIDSHCHIAGEEFAGDLEAVVSRARGAGVAKALCILGAGDAVDAAGAARVRRVWPQVHFAVGIHPHHADDFARREDEAMKIVRSELETERACAIGEIGLDYHYDFSPRLVQQEVFRRQIALARLLRLPVIIHTREATDDTFGILREQGAVRGVFHCFTGDEAMARAALDMDFYLSFAGIVTFPRAAELRDAARFVPADRLLAETDSPYLAPVPFRGKRNEPAHVVRVVGKLAEVRSETPEVLAAQTDVNFAALFEAVSAQNAVPPTA
jgi:TatD DNase family protein